MKIIDLSTCLLQKNDENQVYLRTSQHQRSTRANARRGDLNLGRAEKFCPLWGLKYYWVVLTVFEIEQKFAEIIRFFFLGNFSIHAPSFSFSPICDILPKQKIAKHAQR